MSSWSTRQKVLLFAVELPLIVSGVNLMGDRYLSPLSIWTQLVVAAICCGLIAVLAVYGRRRAPRATQDQADCHRRFM